MDYLKIFSIEKLPVVGRILNGTPDNIACSKCGRKIKDYESVLLELEVIPKCNLFEDETGEIFCTENFYLLLQNNRISGYKASLASLVGSKKESADQRIFHLIIQGKADGPWMTHVIDGICSLCGSYKAKYTKSVKELFEEITAISFGDTSKTNSLIVDMSTWDKSDFFTLSESRTIVITNRVRELLHKIGDIEQEKIDNLSILSAFTPNYLSVVNEYQQKKPKCSVTLLAKWKPKYDTEGS